MAKTNLALQTLRQSLHLSSSQLNQYLLCSKKYEYSYVKGLKPTHISINLLFGTAIHTVLEAFYLYYQQHQEPLSLEALNQKFMDYLATEVVTSKIPIKYTKDLCDLGAVEEMGTKMLKSVTENIDLTDYTIEGVELPLSAPLYDEAGCETGFDLVGVVDLLLRDKASGHYIAVDHKTSRNSYSQSVCDDSHQMSLYAYLLQENGYLKDGELFHGRFDVLRKLKTPKFEQAELTRTSDQITKFTELACSVLDAVDKQVYIPTYSWACSDCSYCKLCRG